MSSITIQSNLASLRTQRRLGTATSSLQRSYERLSSGLRIVHASDDAAGLAVASALGLNSRVFTQGIRNANDAISVLNIAEGATSQLSNVVGRLKELAESAANGTMTLSQRRSLDSEASELVNEYNRIVQTTKFNGLNLLDATFGSQAVQLGYTSQFGVNISTGSELDRGVGTGSFSTTASLISGAGGGATVSTADFNNDGRADIFISDDATGNGKVYLGNSSGGFTAGATINTGGSGATGRTGDFNNDGKADILTMNGTGSLRLFLGNGSGSFSLTSTTATGADSTFEVADVNNDGLLDFVGLSGSGNIYVRNGTGSGFTASQTLVGSPSSGIAIGDLNGDGHIDILNTETGSNRIRSFTNDGTGRFASSGVTALSVALPTNASLGDLNHDGYDDLVYATGGAVYRAMGNGNGTFATAAVVDSSADWAHIGDVNGDGNLDIISAIVGVDAATYLGNGDGSFGSPTTSPLSGGFDDFAMADYTGDGAIDLMYLDGSGLNQLNLYRGSSTQVSTIGRLDLLDVRSARGALDATTELLNRITKELGAIGAAQSRLDTAT